MATNESSALLRFIEMANQEPILDSLRPEPEVPPSLAIQPSRAETTVVTDPFSKPRRSGKLAAYIACAFGLAVLGVGLGSYLNGKATKSAATAAAPVAATGTPGNSNGNVPEAAAPAAVPLDTTAKKDVATNNNEVAPAATAVEPETATPPAEPAAAEPLVAAPVKEAAAEPAAAEPAAAPTPSAKATGMFMSEPPGASVTLFADGKAVTSLKAPAQIELEAGKSYAATFAKAGYAPVTRPVTLSGNSVRVVAVMEKIGSAKTAKVVEAKPEPVAAEPATPSRSRFARRTAKTTKTPTTRRSRAAELRSRRRAARAERRKSRAQRRTKRVAAKSTKKSSGKTGMLMVGAKPPCRIYIGGRYRGMTPARAIALPEGSHRLILVNREHGIRAGGTVVIKAGRNTRVIRDLRSRMKKR